MIQLPGLENRVKGKFNQLPRRKGFDVSKSKISGAKIKAVNKGKKRHSQYT